MSSSVVHIDFSAVLDRPETEIKLEFDKLFKIQVGDMLIVAAKRRCSGIFLGIKEAAQSQFAEELDMLDPHVFISDFVLGPVKIPFYDIMWYKIISRISDAADER